MTDLEQVHERLRVIELAVTPTLNKVVLDEAVDRVLKSKTQRQLRHRYILSLGSTLNIFTQEFSGRYLDTITSFEIEGWLDNDDWSAETRRGYLKNVRTLFSFGLKRQWVLRNAALDVDWPQQDNKPPGILTPQQNEIFFRVCERLDPDLTSWLGSQCFGGLRKCEANILERVDNGEAQSDEGRNTVSGDYVRIKAWKCKTRNRRLIFINPTLRAWLNEDGGLPAINWRKRLERIVKELPFAIPRNALRHSFVSYAYPIYGAEKVAEWSGHSEDVLFKNYREMVTLQQAEDYFGTMPTIPQLEFDFLKRESSKHCKLAAA